MYCQFTFGENSSDEFGVIAVDFEDGNNNRYHSGQSTDLVTDRAANALEDEIISQNYKDPMEFTLSVINSDGSIITQEQERSLCKWLCQRGVYNWLFINDERYSDVWIRCNISNPQTWTVGDVVGMQFTVRASSSIAFSDEIEEIIQITEPNQTISIYVSNDEESEIIPEMEIQMLASGTLTIRNSNDNEDYFTEIKNVETMEIIKTSNDDISSNLSSHDIINDYNLKVPKLYDEYNYLTFNLPCTITLKYRSYRKVVVN